MSYLAEQVANWTEEHGNAASADEMRDRITERQADQKLGQFRQQLGRLYGEMQAGERPEAMAQAFASIAAFFYTPGGMIPGDDEARVYNDTAFQQRGMLGNLCNNAAWMVENAEKRLDELYAKLDQQEAVFDDTEIARKNLNITMDQLERMQHVQLPACYEWLSLTKAAHAEITGEEWKPFAKKGKSPAEQSTDATMERLRRLRGK